MIPFFRKIRKKMADDNKPMKYMRYAIGEIILVVIGILIALQINNSNNTNKQRKIEQEYLLSLQTEFNTNLKSLDECILKSEEIIKSIDELLTLLEKNLS